MDIAILVFMILVLALCVFTIGVVIHDYLRERKRKQAEKNLYEMVETKLDLLEAYHDLTYARQDELDERQNGFEQRLAKLEAKQKELESKLNRQRVVMAQPQTDDGVVEQPMAVVYGEEGNIAFNAEPKLSHKEKHDALSSEQKSWYNEIVNYANNVEGVKSVITNGYEEYKLFSKRVIRLRIKKGTVICEFQIANPSFSQYVSSNKISVKQAATSFKILTAKDVGAAKDSIDIAVQTIKEAKEEAKRQQRERRKLARQAAATTAKKSGK